jgi:hypothetical protein
VPGEIHEHIRGVAANDFFDKITRLTHKIAPNRSIFLQPFRAGIFLIMIVVKIDFELVLINMLKKRLNEIGTSMVAQIGRKNRQPNSSYGIDGIRERRNGLGAHETTIGHVFLVELPPRYVLKVIECKEPEAAS